MNFQITGRGFVIALIFAVLIAAGCSDQGDRVNVLLEYGVKKFESKDYANAQRAFVEALKVDKETAKAYFYLGKIAVIQGNADAALNNFNSAVTRNANYTDARLQLGRVYANSQKLAEAQEQIDAILSHDTANNDAHALQAMVLLKQGKEQEAVTLLQKVLKSEPGNLLATELIARYYLTKGEEDKTLRVLELANEANAGTEDSILRPLFALYSNRKLSSEAEKVILQLVKNNQNNLQYYEALIDFYARLDRINDAALVIRDSIAKDPENDARYQLLIDLYKKYFGLRKAIDETRQLINDKPEKSSLRLALASLYVANDQVDLAEKVYQGVVKMEADEPNGLTAKVEIARFKVRQNSLSEAEKILDEVLTKDPKHEAALILNSGIAQRHNDFNLAMSMLDEVIKINPANMQARMQKAVLLQRQGKLDESLAQVDAVLNLKDNLVPVLKLKAKILTQQRNYSQLELVYTQLETASPNTVDGPLGKGILYLNQKKFQQSVVEFEKAYLRDSKSAEVLQGLITAKIAAEETEEAKAFLKKIVMENPRHPLAVELLGSVYLSEKEYIKAEKEFLRQLEIGASSQTIYIRLAQSRMLRDDNEGAFEALNSGVEKQPRNINLLIKLAQAYQLDGKLDKAEETLEKSIAIAPRNVKLKKMLASVREKQQ